MYFAYLLTVISTCQQLIMYLNFLKYIKILHIRHFILGTEVQFLLWHPSKQDLNYTNQVIKQQLLHTGQLSFSASEVTQWSFPSSPTCMNEFVTLVIEQSCAENIAYFPHHQLLYDICFVFFLQSLVRHLIYFFLLIEFNHLLFHTMTRESLSLCPCGLQKKKFILVRRLQIWVPGGLGSSFSFFDSLGESRKVTSFYFLSISVVRLNETCF